MQKIIIKKKEPIQSTEVKFDPSDWVARNELVEAKGGINKFSASIGRSPATVRKWLRDPSKGKSKEPSDYEMELMRRIAKS